MSSDIRTPSWPFLFIVACLLVLSVAAPQVWRSMSEGPETLAEASADEPDADRTDEPSPVEPADAEPSDREPPQVQPSPPRADLHRLAAGPQVAPAAPAVQDPFDADPAVASHAGPPQQEMNPATVAATKDEPKLIVVPPDEEEMPEPAVPQQPSGPPSPWPRCLPLVARLEALAEHDRTADWSRSALVELERLQQVDSLVAPESTVALQALFHLTGRGKELTGQMEPNHLRSEVLRAGYGMARRVAIWGLVHEMHTEAGGEPALAPRDAQALMRAVNTADKYLLTFDDKGSWRTYLLMDPLRDAAMRNDAGEVEACRALARKVLVRIESPRLSASQRKLMESDSLAPLVTQLRRWSAAEVDYVELLCLLEQYEQSRSPQDAQRIVQLQREVRFSDNKDRRLLADRIDKYYRNANVRLAVSGELVNRLVPAIQPFEDDVNDNVLGAHVLGRSQTSANVFVRLFPDRRRWRIGVEANGTVASETASSRGPVTLYGEADTRFLARKLLVVDRRGVRALETDAAAESYGDLTGVASQYDGWPLMGALVRGIAQQQFESQQYQATAEMDRRVASRISRRLDEEIEKRLAKGKQDLQTHLLAPLQKLQLEPVATDLKTTDKRLIARYRLAGGHQLAANTPRPCALSDSLLSVQIHQSAINNLIAQLDLNGKQFELRQLHHYIGEKLNREVQIPEDLPEGVTIRFADEAAVTVRFAEDHVTLAIHLAELTAGKRRWRNFTVLGHYHPESARLDADLVRDGTIELIGKRLNLGDQVALRGVFSKVLSRQRKLSIIHPRLTNDPRLENLAVNQFDIVDGWIGISVGPKRARIARRIVGSEE